MKNKILFFIFLFCKDVSALIQNKTLLCMDNINKICTYLDGNSLSLNIIARYINLDQNFYDMIVESYLYDKKIFYIEESGANTILSKNFNTGDSIYKNNIKTAIQRYMKKYPYRDLIKYLNNHIYFIKEFKSKNLCLLELIRKIQDQDINFGSDAINKILDNRALQLSDYKIFLVHINNVRKLIKNIHISLDCYNNFDIKNLVLGMNVFFFGVIFYYLYLINNPEDIFFSISGRSIITIISSLFPFTLLLFLDYFNRSKMEIRCFINDISNYCNLISLELKKRELY